jgi:hypothetical protein
MESDRRGDESGVVSRTDQQSNSAIYYLKNAKNIENICTCEEKAVPLQP